MPSPIPLIAVIGGGECSAEEAALAEAVGRLLAQAGVGVVCGGRGGVMAAACRGARQAGGVTVGILPGTEPTEANPWVQIAIPTGLGEARNALVVGAGRGVIAIGGEYGTLSEIAFALKAGKRVAGLRTWDIPGVHPVADPAAAVAYVLAASAISSAG
ncbi:MAG: TIGR00725 family protein [Anaerolineae bacterium]|nr:TIGR00725 family protein [Anaerolineae bacterium]